MVHNYSPLQQEIPLLAKAIADKFGTLPQVLTVALAGSRTRGVSSESSDFDFYVYLQEEIPVEIRKAIAQEFAERLEIHNQFWEPGDEWVDISSGCGTESGELLPFRHNTL
jgi:predicted nucleotidyltransferase